MHNDANIPPGSQHSDSKGRQLAYVRMNLVSGVGPIVAARLLAAFGDDPREVFEASRAQLQRVERVGPKVADAIRDREAADAAELELDRADQHGVEIVDRDDPRFPPGLLEIPDPPLLLYVRGALLGEADRGAVGIVGSRRTSYYGRDQARRFGAGLAQAGLTVVSGFARGVDTAAHEGALDVRGRTIAVIGSGLLDIYPPENAELAPEIARDGAVVSEFPLTTPPNAQNFPRRNRIIAGMALGTLVIEAGVKSGAMISARLALEYGRDVWAVPGRIDDERSRGCNGLIKNGAPLVEEPLEIVDTLRVDGHPFPVWLAGVSNHPATSSPRTTPARVQPRDIFHDDEGTPGEAPPDQAGSANRPRRGSAARDEPTPGVPGLTEPERAVHALLTAEPTGIDRLAQSAGRPIHEVLTALTMLEVKGHARQLAGRHYVRTR